MSQPEQKVELHDFVEEYCKEWIEEPQEAPYLHEEIDNISKRTDRYDMFIEFVDNIKNK